MSLVDYAKEILGNERVNELIKEYNLCTKKWNYGNTKNFYKRLKKEIKKVNKEGSK